MRSEAGRGTLEIVALFLLVPLLVGLAATFLVPCVHDRRFDQLVGTYSAVSESEWTLDLTLQANGAAMIDRTWWGGWSDYDKTEHDRLVGTWRVVGNVVTVKYGALQDELCFSQELSRAELGESGAQPGLKACSAPAVESALGSHSLWLVDTR